jgi:hypothetical protein
MGLYLMLSLSEIVPNASIPQLSKAVLLSYVPEEIKRFKTNTRQQVTCTESEQEVLLGRRGTKKIKVIRGIHPRDYLLSRTYS